VEKYGVDSLWGKQIYCGSEIQKKIFLRLKLFAALIFKNDNEPFLD
jgi:hypothetical protein